MIIRIVKVIAKNQLSNFFTFPYESFIYVLINRLKSGFLYLSAK